MTRAASPTDLLSSFCVLLGKLLAKIDGEVAVRWVAGATAAFAAVVAVTRL